MRSGDGRGESPGYDDDKCMTTGGAIFKELTPIATRPGWPYGGTTNSADCGTARWSLKRDRVDEPFPPPAPIVFPLRTSDGSAPNKAVIELKMPLVQSGSIPADLGGSKKGVCGMRLQEMGSILGESLREVMLLCSQPTGGESRVGVHLKQTDTFPLPTLRELLLPLLSEEHAWTVDWLRGICVALNSFWGCPDPTLQEQHRADDRPAVSKMQARILRGLANDVARLKEVQEVTESFDWGEFLSNTYYRLQGRRGEDSVRVLLEEH